MRRVVGPGRRPTGLGRTSYSQRATSFGGLDAPPRRATVRPASREGPRVDILLLILAFAAGMLAAAVPLVRCMGADDLPGE